MNAPLRSSAVALAVFAFALPARAQAPSESEQLFASIKWQEGPDSARIGTESQIAIPANCQFTGAPGARNFMLATENPPSGDELGVMLCSESEESDPWFVVFSFDDSGYVRDTDAGDLDADAILQSFRDGTAEANKERIRRGWAPVNITGWVREPYYDPRTHNLTWAMQASTEGEGGSVNHSVRLLGRAGVMKADLVVDPAQLTSTLPAFDRMVASHAFLPGRRYSEWREGDKLAGYGLTALIAGGAGVAAAKSGLLGKLLKVIFVAVAGFLAWVRSLFSRRKGQDRVA